MANNRMFLCEVNDSGKVISKVKIAKHNGGAWYLFLDENHVNNWFRDVFANGNSIALVDEYHDKPQTVVYHGL